MKNIVVLLMLFLSIDIAAVEKKSVTIYVHGTQQFGSKLLSKDIWYCPEGLHAISQLPDTSMMVKDAQLLQKGDKNLFNLEHYYTFGWSGKLSFKEREKAGKILYVEIQKLLDQYKNKYGKYPLIRLLTFSHGGNVALNMIKELPFFNEEKVDLELILVACPVQKTTENMINHTCISRSYVIYSTLDVLQVADRYKYKGEKHFPKRFFDTNKDNCYQIMVTVNHKRLGHIDLWHSFMRHIPKSLQISLQNSYDINRCTSYNFVDQEFTFYRGINLFHSIKASRKKSKQNNY